MASVKLKIAELRREKGIGQQDLAEVLGVSFQAVSKWENGITMPDITLLPDIAEYFNVTLDELLGIKPLRHQAYIPINTDDHNTSNGKEKNIYKNRAYFWNSDYLSFLIREVWSLKSPIDVIEFRCCDGYLGTQLLEYLPTGSTYTGVDNKYFTDIARHKFNNVEHLSNFIASDLYTFESTKKYDLAIIQVGLRHMNRPLEVLNKMKDSVKKGGLIVCIDVNREFENDGLYIDGIDYDYLCTAFDFHKVWKKELEYEGRDYAIGMRLPFYMQKLGLKDIDVRMNDRALYVHPDMEGYDEVVQDMIEIHGWNRPIVSKDKENIIDFFMNRGMDRVQAEGYIKRQTDIKEYFKKESNKSFLFLQGLLIAYGRK